MEEDFFEDKEIIKAKETMEKKCSKKDSKTYLKIAQELAKKNIEKEGIIASFFTNVYCNKKIDPEEIKKEFGEKTFRILEECKKIDEIIDNNFKKIPSETLSSIILSIATDIQTIIIKMTEMKELIKNHEEKDEKKIVYVTKNVYVPLSIKLGIADLNWQLGDYCFKIEKPKEYEKIKKLVRKTREERQKLVENFAEEIKKILEKNNINAQVFGRPKSFQSIHKKLEKTPFEKMHDIYGIRIICNKEKECYEILGHIHSKYEFVKEAFDNYMTEKNNKNYQSLHTAIKFGKDIIEVQIRTWQQHLRIESNLYWEYKRLRKNRELEKELSWERQLIEWQKRIGKQTSVRKIGENKIFVFTPKNEIITLPKESTVLDFAFAVHTEIGRKAKAAKVNGIMKNLDAKLNNLDRIDIITEEKNKIKRNWLNFVITEKAKSKIKRQFKIITRKKNKDMKISQKQEKKIKMADCCHPLPGEDVLGVKTTKRKIIIHKKNCKNVKDLPKEKIIEINFEKSKGKTKIKVTAIDRIGLLSEILEEFEKNKIILTNTNFNIKKTGYVEAIFEIEIRNIKTLEKLIEKIESVPSVQNVERE